MEKIKVGIIGATGYAGINTVKLIAEHPQTEIIWLTSRSAKDKKIQDVFPHLKNIVDVTCMNPEIDSDVLKDIDVVFLALAHGEAMKIAPAIINAGKKVVDLGADFRLNDKAVFEQWYCTPHACGDSLNDTVYGLSEINRTDIAKAKLIANPGCYPTSAILALAPLLKDKKIMPHDIIIDAKSGVSGAGRNPSQPTHYPECNDGISAYKITDHRHKPEIAQEVSKLAGADASINFVPHLTPMTRGILSTIYANLTAPANKDELIGLYEEFYKDSFFVRIAKDHLPSTKHVYGSNFCDISFEVDPDTKKIIIVSAIDNLIKGAAGQAVQNMNIMFGLDEKAGLSFGGIYP